MYRRESKYESGVLHLLNSKILLRGLQELLFWPFFRLQPRLFPRSPGCFITPTGCSLPPSCFSFAPAGLLTARPSTAIAELVPLDLHTSASTLPIFQGQFPMCPPRQVEAAAFFVPPGAWRSHRHRDLLVFSPPWVMRSLNAKGLDLSAFACGLVQSLDRHGCSGHICWKHGP